MLYIRGYIFVEGCRNQHIICQSIDDIVFTNSWIMYLKVTCGRDATMGIQRNKGRAGCYFCAIFPPSHPRFLSDHALNKQTGGFLVPRSSRTNKLNENQQLLLNTNSLRTLTSHFSFIVIIYWKFFPSIATK